MPKETRDSSVSSDRFMASSRRSLSQAKHPISENGLKIDGNVKEWEEARCPVCLEHPHNAILLLCSSHDKGCHPFMCDTGDLHSNCFDLFKKSFTKDPETTEGAVHRFIEPLVSAARIIRGWNVEGSSSMSPILLEEKDKPKLMCPMCRGKIMGWIVVDSARCFMDEKARSCTYEECDFSGTYSDLQKHAKTVHPFVRPAVADPMRQRKWDRLERVHDHRDLITAMRSPIIGEDTVERSEYVAGQLLSSLRFTLTREDTIDGPEYDDIELPSSPLSPILEEITEEMPEATDSDLLTVRMLADIVNGSTRGESSEIVRPAPEEELHQNELPSAQSIGSSGNVVVTSGRRSRSQRGESPDGEVQYRSSDGGPERDRGSQRRRRRRS